MAPFTIDEATFGSLAGKVVLITGGSSGIGLATAQLLHQQKVKVLVVDRQAPDSTLLDTAGDDNLAFVEADVTSWKTLTHAFDTAIQNWGRLDHVFANAGIGGRAMYDEDDVDEQGNLKEPDHATIHINLIGVANTVKLAVHHLRKQGHGGSIVLTASTAAYQRFSVSDYAAAKHGVLGLMRSMESRLYPALPIRMNAVAPSWTDTKIVPRDAIDTCGVAFQEPEVVARSVALLMGDDQRNQQVIYSIDGKYSEIEEHLLTAAKGIALKQASEEEDLQRVLAAMQAMGAWS